MQNIVLDMGGGYAFSPYPSVELPAGAYYPYDTGEMLVLNPFTGSTAEQATSEGVGQRVVVPNPKERHFPMHEYNRALSLAREDIGWFLKAKSVYEERGAAYKRGIMLYGPPGTGKSRFVADIERQLITEHDAISIHIETRTHLEAISWYLLRLAEVLEGRFKLIIIEELADLSDNADARTRALNLLESAILRNDVLFLVTTNRASAIPRNLVDRPSRLDLLLEVAPLDLEEGFVEAWHEFVTGEPFPERERGQRWVAEAREQLTPVYWTELFRMAQIRGMSLDQAWLEIKRRREIIERNFEEESVPIGFRTSNEPEFGRQRRFR